MKDRPDVPPDLRAMLTMPLSRRRFVQGMSLGGSALALGLVHPSRAWALTGHAPLPTLTGTHFALDVAEIPVNFTGRPRLATTVNGSLPGPILRWKEGQQVSIQVTNHLDVATSVHWHGILLPFQMDGVPGISFPGIAPGETFTYRFPVKQSGTYWYHSHSHFQEQTGLYGPLVIEPANGERHTTERDYVVILNDWSDESPTHIFNTLRKQSDFYNLDQPTVPEFFHDVRVMGLQQALAKRRMWNQMRMNPGDIADVTGYTYTYLMNGVTPAGNWTGLFSRGERVRLRVINGSAMTYFDVRIPGLKMTVVAADGQDVEPITVDEIRMAPAETYDVIVTPSDDRAWTIFAQSMDSSGYACGTLTPHLGMTAAVPAMDRPPRLTMTDMMGAMSGMSHDSPEHDAHNMNDMSDMAGMDHDGMENMTDMSSMEHGSMVMPSHHDDKQTQVMHGAGVDMRVADPRINLDDPGTGLRDNGRHVLTYADLHTIGGSIDSHEPGREIELHLTGNMERYAWSFNGMEAMDAKPLYFRAGERLRLVLTNDTMMNHPIHLHGMWSEVVNPDGQFQVRKHTVNVQPAQRIAYDVSADALGRWAYHCHLLYHMEAGMFREVVVS